MSQRIGATIMFNAFKSRRATSMLLLSLWLLVLGLLTGCSPTESAPGSGSNPAAELTPEAVHACESLFGRKSPGTGPEIVGVIDHTASVAPEELPTAFADALSAASLEDGSLTLIGVEGAGVAPRIIAKHLALSTEGPRDRPSVKKVADVVPACVEQVLLPQAVAEAKGTDLHRALALASEMTGEGSELWVQTDLLSTAGPFSLDSSILRLDPEVAAKRIAKQAPVNLKGVRTHFVGIGQTTTPLYTADREWLRDLGRGLCSAWGAQGCSRIETEPVDAVAPASALAKDPVPAFPSVRAAGTAGACRFDVPASLTFAGGSAELRDDATVILAAPLRLAREQSDATIEVIGHTASLRSATAKEQRRFSRERADAVAQLFFDVGVAPSRVRAIGVGDSRPLAEDIDAVTGDQIEEIAAAERRVEVVITGVSCPKG